MNVTDFLSQQVRRSSLDERWHFLPWRLEYLKEQNFKDAFTLLFHDDKYIRLREQRTAQYNKVLELQDIPSTTPSRLRAALHAIIEIDDKMAKYILQYIARYTYDQANTELWTMDGMKKELGETTSEQDELLVHLATVHRRLGFKCDSIENDVIAIEDDMRKLMPNLTFAGADGVKVALSQLRTLIDQTNEKLENDEEKMLYADTADSISDYIDRCINTFMKRIAEMRNKEKEE